MAAVPSLAATFEPVSDPVFWPENALLLKDPEHSTDEDRFLPAFRTRR